MVDGKITAFEDLIVWQESQDLAVLAYKLSKSFPKEEVFGLTSQLKRAATSVSANIAEGFGRRSQKDKLHFYAIAYGSLLETKNFFYLCQKLGYTSAQEIEALLAKVTSRQKLLNALMRSLQS